jgi:cell wall-associated NlpC family hydrolase
VAVALSFSLPLSVGSFEAYAAKSAEVKLPKGRYVIRPLASDTRVVTVKNGSKKNGANIYLYTGDMAKNQLFDVSYDSKGRALIKNVGSKKYLSVAGKKAKKGANVVQTSMSSSKQLRWVLEPAGTSYGQPVFRVRSALSSKYCLQLAGGNNRDAANIRLWGKSKSKAEKFVFVSVKTEVAPEAEPAIADGVYRIGSALSSSLSLAIPDASTKSGVVPALASKNNLLSQLFIFTYEKGYYRIRPLINGKSLTIKAGNVLAKASAAQYTDEAKSYQRFKIVKKPNGTYGLTVKAGGLALRVQSGAARSGGALETWYPSSARSQEFTLTPVASVKFSTGWYTVSPFGKAGLNLSIAESSRASGAAASVSEDTRSFAQKFQVTRTAQKSGDDYSYTIENANSQLTLTASGSTVVQTEAADGDPDEDQLWYAKLSVGGVRFISKSTGKALQLTGGAGNYGVKLAKPSESAKQVFMPVEVALFDSGQYRLDTYEGDLSLEVENASFFKQANIQTGEADGSGAQAWFVRAHSDGSVTIRNERSGKPAESSGENVRQNASSGSRAQRWFIEESGGGWFKLRSAAGDTYMEADVDSVDAAGNMNVGVAPAVVDGDTPAGMKWRFVPVKVTKPGPAMPKAAAAAVEKEARKHLGKKYVFGAEGPNTFDCSGYIYYVMNHSGVREMSRVTAQDIYDSCVKIPAKDAKRGDLIFFKNTYKTDRIVTHLGIYLGGGKMIHAGSPVQVSKVNTKYYKAHFYAYARLS